MDELKKRALLESLVSVSYEDRLAACQNLADIGLLQEEAITTLASAYSECGKEEISAFLSLLAHSSNTTVLLNTLAQKKPAQVLAAATLLLAQGPESYTKEIEAFEKFVRIVRRKKIPANDTPEKEQIVWAKIRELAIWLLLPFAGRARETLTHIAFDSSIWPIALTALGVPGPGSQEGLSALTRALSVKSPVRQIKDHPAVQLIPEKAADALANLGPQAHMAIPDILAKEKTAFVSTRFLIWQAMPALHPAESPHGPAVAIAFVNALPTIFSYCEDLDYDESTALDIARKLWPLSLTALYTSPRSTCRSLANELLKEENSTIDAYADDIVQYLRHTNWPATMFNTVELLLGRSAKKKELISKLERITASEEISPQALVGLVHALSEAGKKEVLEPTFVRLNSLLQNSETLLATLESLDYLLDNFAVTYDFLKKEKQRLLPKMFEIIASPSGNGKERTVVRDETAKFLRHFCPLDDKAKSAVKELLDKLPPSAATKYLRRYLR